MEIYRLSTDHTSSRPLPSSSTTADYFTAAPFFRANPSFCLAVTLFIVLPTLGHLTWKDYKSFLDLGPGGTPSNFYGYLRIVFLRTLFALKDPCSPGHIPLEALNSGYLDARSFPRRNSSRPVVTGIAPHRQMNQRPDPSIYELLSSSIRKLAEDHPKRLRIATSSFEKHCAALFSNRQVNKTKKGEIAHAHPLDGSLHMTLHPVDAKIVIENGWGERHPLARGGWCSRFVPVGFIMIYAPRTAEEVRVVMNIIKAGAAWVGGEPLSEDSEKEAEGSAPTDAPPSYVESCVGCTCSVA